VRIESSGWGALAIVAVMTVVTLVTRWGGVFVMSFVPINDAVKRFIGAMSGSVLVAMLAPLALRGDTGARAALAVTAVTVLVLRKPLLSVAAGIVTAALLRQL